jgi:glycerol-3-phosphate dehydrogenase (NAD(P)+)
MTQQQKRIAIIGAGAWGTALSQVLADAGRSISLYARAPELTEAINGYGQNETYLSGIFLNNNIRATSDIAAAVKEADIVLLATPTQFTRSVLTQLKPHLPPHVPLVSCAKGIEIATGKLLSEVAAEIIPAAPYAVLSGPTFAYEVAKGLPTAVTFATQSKQGEHWAQALSSKNFRPYLSNDVVGAETSGALKNVIAIACGIVEGKGLGENAKAAVMTRGMAEIKRLGLKRGAETDTFLGLSGVGDLTLTCNSMASRNYSLGVMLGQGRKLANILAERNNVAEGVTTAKAIALNAHKLQVEMPISAAIDKVLHHDVDINTVIQDLLARDLKQESL